MHAYQSLLLSHRRAHLSVSPTVPLQLIIAEKLQWFAIVCTMPCFGAHADVLRHPTSRPAASASAISVHPLPLHASNGMFFRNQNRAFRDSKRLDQGKIQALRATTRTLMDDAGVSYSYCHSK